MDGGDGALALVCSWERLRALVTCGACCEVTSRGRFLPGDGFLTGSSSTSIGDSLLPGIADDLGGVRGPRTVAGDDGGEETPALAAGISCEQGIVASACPGFAVRVGGGTEAREVEACDVEACDVEASDVEGR